jgi:hypothetical protein
MMRDTEYVSDNMVVAVVILRFQIVFFFFYECILRFLVTTVIVDDKKLCNLDVYTCLSHDVVWCGYSCDC